MDDCIEAREQAYALYEAEGDGLSEGRSAVWLWEHHQLKARPWIAGGWLRRARRALEADTESIEFGDLLLREAEGRARIRRARTGDGAGPRRLGAGTTAVVDRPRGGGAADNRPAPHRRGRLTEGLGHLDEAMLSAVEGKLNPYTTGKVYCSLISACEQLGDLSRARSGPMPRSAGRRTTRWRCGQASAGSTTRAAPATWRLGRGRARSTTGVHRARRVPRANVAAGYIEIGEIRRRLGDLEGAEEVGATAEELCGQQSAGLALVRLAQRRVDAATAIITRMLEDHTWNRLARGELLQAGADRGGGGRTSTLRSRPPTSWRASSPSTTARHWGRSPMRTGRLQLAQGDDRTACGTLREALQHWRQLEVPYEVATSACCSARPVGAAATRTGPPTRSPTR